MQKGKKQLLLIKKKKSNNAKSERTLKKSKILKGAAYSKVHNGLKVKREQKGLKEQVDSEIKQIASVPQNVFRLEAVVVHNMGARESQQDNYAFSTLSDTKLVKTKGVLAVVADGMGGLKNGAEVSGIATYVFKEYFEKNHFQWDTHIELLNMLQDANEKVKNYIMQMGGEMSGSTLIATIVKDYKLNFLSVGDSRIYLLRGGKLLQLNREHVYARELDVRASMGEISIDTAYTDSQRKSLTSYVGQNHIEWVDFNIEPITVMPGDLILLMSDGVFGTLDEETMEEVLRMPYLGQAATKLEETILACKKQGQDNFTALILKIQ